MPLFYHIKRLHAPHKLRMSPFYLTEYDQLFFSSKYGIVSCAQQSSPSYISSP